ncbi:nucleotide-binding domain-containing protein [Nostoc sp.]|uniref:nucleotide-binding domain-containing protein n=1 Tax=Nostoc sp. TaxID=1180 RepID=UPI003FA60A7A
MYKRSNKLNSRLYHSSSLFLIGMRCLKLTSHVDAERSEAEMNNDLGHPAGKGLVTTERSSYKGIHYMDCVVRQYGRIVGVKRVKVIIILVRMPAEPLLALRLSLISVPYPMFCNK